MRQLFQKQRFFLNDKTYTLIAVLIPYINPAHFLQELTPYVIYEIQTKCKRFI